MFTFLIYTFLCKYLLKQLPICFKVFQGYWSKYYQCFDYNCDFNIRDSNWNDSYSFHSAHSNTLFEIVDSFNFSLSLPIYQVPTWYSNNNNNSNLVINLYFLCFNSIELNIYIILPELCYFSDYALLIVDILIIEELIHNEYCTIVKNSKEEKEFIAEFIKGIENINTTNILNKDNLECIV